MKKKLLFAAIILAAAGIASYFLFIDSNDEVKFRTQKISKGDIQATVTATGTMNPVTTVLVGTQVSGTIKELYADFNSRVTRGQVIALIDPASFEAQVAQSRANLLSSVANLKKSEASLQDSRRTMNRNKQLFEKGYIARSDFDTAETNYETAVAQVDASKAQVAQAEASLSLAETNLRYTRISSPVDGIVISRNIDVGQTVAASFQTPTLFSIAQDLGKMQIDTNITEADIARIVMDQQVEFTVDAYPDVLFRGKVSQIRIAPITVQNVVTYDVVINVDNRDLKLKPGMTANVSVILSNKKDVLKIPNAALRFRYDDPKAEPQAQKGARGPGIWLLEKGKPKRVKITPGISDGNYTEVASGEVREGQDVIVEMTSKAKKTSQTGPPRLF